MLLEKILPAIAEDTTDTGSIPGSGIYPGVRNGTLLLPGKFHGQRSLVGYITWAAKNWT